MENLLTTDQAKVKNGIITALYSGSRRIVLKGSAGVGKTFLINTLLQEYQPMRGIIYVAAPTHKALAVIKDKITNDDGITFCTVHSGLRLKRVIKKGKILFEKGKEQGFANCGLLVIDEASMIGKDILGHLEEYDFPILFIGDDKQINPVKEKNSPVFEQHWREFVLDKIVRQSLGNPIITLSRNLSLLDSNIADINEEKGYLFTTDRYKVIQRLAEANGSNDLKYLSWTNADVDTVNNSVRRLLYGEDARLVELGETLVVDSPYKKYYTNQEVVVEKLSVLTKKVTSHKLLPVINIRYYLINNEIEVVHEDSIRDFKMTCSELKTLTIDGKASWKNYYMFLESFLSFKYNHALTVHKSQGSTYKDAIINVKNIKRNPDKVEKERLLYTAVTRPSEKLIIFNP